MVHLSMSPDMGLSGGKQFLGNRKRGGAQNKTKVHSNRYKTELCRAFLEKGQCKYGEKCQVCC